MDFDPCIANSETTYTSITPYVEFLMNSHLKRFFFIEDAVLVFCLLCFAFLRRLNHYLCAECLRFCIRQRPTYCLHLSIRMGDRDIGPLVRSSWGRTDGRPSEAMILAVMNE